MKSIRVFFCFAASIGLLMLPQVSAAQSLSATTTFFNADQGDGGAVIDLQNLQISGTVGTTAAFGAGGSVTVPIGPEPLQDYVFFSNTDLAAGLAITPLADGPNMIIGPSIANAGVNGGTENTFLGINTAGTTLNPAGAPLGVQVSDVSGTVDLTGFSTGSVFVIYGSFTDPTVATATLSDGATVLNASGDVIQFGGGLDNTDSTPFVVADPATDIIIPEVGSGSIVTAFDFDTLGGTFTDFTFNALHGDADGSRARIAGVVVVAEAIPEPSSAALLGLCGLGMVYRRRRKS